MPRLNSIYLPAEQAVYSLSTFLVTIIAARNLSVEHFGAFALSINICLVLVGLQRAYLSEPLLLLTGQGHDGGADAPFIHRIFRLSIIFGGCAALTIGVGLAIAGYGSLHIALIALVVLPFVQDLARYCLISQGKKGVALAFTFCALLMQAGTMTIATFLDGPVVLLCAWAAGGGIALVAFGRLAFFPVRQNSKVVSRTEAKTLGRQFGSDYVLGVFSLQSTLLTATFVAGAPALAALRGADTLVGPFRILLQTLPAMLLPIWSSRLAASRSSIKQVMSAILFAALGVTAWGTVLLLTPDYMGEHLLGESWQVAKPVLPVIIFSLYFIAVTNIASVATKAIRSGKQLLVSRLILLPISLVCGVGGAALAGAHGAAIGSLITSVIASFIWLRTFNKAHIKIFTSEKG